MLDLILHLDTHLLALVNQYGVWIYAILFLIIFSETGLVVAPFLHAAVARADTPAGVPHIATYTVTLTLQGNGVLDVREVIDYDFGVVPRHGIYRDIPVREVYGTDGKYDRVYEIRNVHVTTSGGTPGQTSVGTQGDYRRIRIGDANTTITGLHTYTIDYPVVGAPTTFASHDELNWDAVGNQWAVPIDRADVTVRAPATITRVACYAGAQGSHYTCDRSAHAGTTGRFAQAGLGAEEGVTVVIALPKGSIQPPPRPLLEKNWNVDDAFARRADTVGPGVALAALGIGAVSLLVWRKGRDRRYVGSPVDQAMGNVSGAEERVPPFGEQRGPVEFVPPDTIRPGQVGVLLDEQPNLLDVTATIVDLAVRGYLRITELPAEGVFRRHHDYQLTRIDVGTAKMGALLPYEIIVLDGLFSTGDTVKLSDLKYKFRAHLLEIDNALYDDVVKEGWYRARPDKTRGAWHALGILLVVVGAAAIYLAARYSTYGLVPVGIFVTGIVLTAQAHRMPARTGKGSAMLSRVRGFRRLFDEGDEDLRARFAEQHDIFSQYLPYAIVFGCTEKWAKVFEGLGAEELGGAGWYQGNEPFNAMLLAHSMNDFGTVATGTLYASQPSSSSSSGFGGGGFSGGGGGGGGGGSW